MSARHIAAGLACCAVLLGSAGCARNAVFELELDLPAQPAGVTPLYAVVQVRNDADFSADWSTVVPLEGIPLNPSCPSSAVTCGDRELSGCSAVVSVVGDGADFTRRLRVRVRFCASPSCEGSDDATPPQAHIEVERALYQGRYTQGRVCIDSVPPTPTPEASVVGRCDVRCRDGEAVMHCRADGSHFCEDP